MRTSVTTFAFLFAALATTGCSLLVSIDGLSAGSDADGGGTASGSGGGAGGGASGSGVVLGDAAVSPPGLGTGADAGSPPPGNADAAGPGSSGPDSGAVGSGSGLDAAGGADTSPGVDASPTACSLGNARVFVTSTMYDGKLGGVSGADGDCNARAAAAGLGGSWRAWLSDSFTPAVAHIRRSKAGYVLVDGTTVATSFVTLVSGSLAHAIDRTETGAAVTNGQTEVWTGIDVTSGMGNGGFCTDGSGNDWSSNSSSASTPLVGHLDATDATWSAAYLQVCNRTNVRLYCFEACP